MAPRSMSAFGSKADIARTCSANFAVTHNAAPSSEYARVQNPLPGEAHEAAAIHQAIRQRCSCSIARATGQRPRTIPIAVAIMTPALRIVSFLPSATEMACALGLAEQLVGVTHECDYPPEIKEKPIVVRSVLSVENMSEQEIDRAVRVRLRSEQSLYRVDEQLLRKLTPDLILTQDLCQVCAPSEMKFLRC